jgi:hypothetical protein
MPPTRAHLNFPIKPELLAREVASRGPRVSVYRSIRQPTPSNSDCVSLTSCLSVNDGHAPPAGPVKEPNGLAGRDVNATAAPPQTGGLAVARQM